MTKIKLSQLKSLPKEELLAIVNQTMKLKESKKSKTVEYYLENANDGQLSFHKAKHRIRLMFSGNRGGKSTAGCVETIMRAQGTHPFHKIRTPRKQLVVAMDFENHVKNTLEGKFQQWAPTGSIQRVEKNQNGAWKRIYWANGSTTDFASQDQDLKVFEGSDYDDCWVDEPCTQQIYNAIWRGLTDRGGSLWLTGTPITQPWLYNKLWLPAQNGSELIWAIAYSTELNATNIGEGDKELGLKRIGEFTSQLSDDEKAARLDGKFLQMQGLIFKEWNRAKHIIPSFHWPANWPIYESIDPHPQKPWAISWIGIAENGSAILLRSGLYEGVIETIAEQILIEREQLEIQNDRKPRILHTIIDNYASVPMMQRSNTDPTAKRKSVRDELEAYIGPPRVIVAPKNVRSKIELFRSMLHIGEEDECKFYCFDIPENERFIYEIENYVWDTKRGGLMNGLKDTPRKIDDDILDSIMQVVLTLPKINQEAPEPISMSEHSSYRM